MTDDPVVWCVCVCVCVCVCMSVTSLHHAERAERIDVFFWIETLVSCGPRLIVLRLCLDPLQWCGGGIFARRKV